MADEQPPERPEPKITFSVSWEGVDIVRYSPVWLEDGEYNLPAYNGPADGQRHKFTIESKSDQPFAPQRIHCVAQLGEQRGILTVTVGMPGGWYRPAFRAHKKRPLELCLVWDENYKKLPLGNT